MDDIYWGTPPPPVMLSGASGIPPLYNCDQYNAALVCVREADFTFITSNLENFHFLGALVV